MKNTNELKDLELSDLLDINVLQDFQDNFAISANLASVTVDRNGNPITKPSNYVNMCANFTGKSVEGKARCAKSHSDGGKEAARIGKPYIYKCHAGLIDFAAPILVENELIATILGGQTLKGAPDEAYIKRVAGEIGVNPDAYFSAAKEISVRTEESINASAQILFIFANSLSQIGYEQYKFRGMSNTMTTNFSQISATMQELASTSVTVADNQHVLNDEIKNIKEISAEINAILDSIKLIADRTNRLGINAAIEAAHANEAGKGFGVVASEIRKLSVNSKETASKISELTKKIEDSVDETLKTSDSTLENTEQQSAAIEETTASVEELVSLTEELDKLVNKQ